MGRADTINNCLILSIIYLSIPHGTSYISEYVTLSCDLNYEATYWGLRLDTHEEKEQLMLELLLSSYNVRHAKHHLWMNYIMTLCNYRKKNPNC